MRLPLLLITLIATACSGCFCEEHLRRRDWRDPDETWQADATLVVWQITYGIHDEDAPDVVWFHTTCDTMPVDGRTAINYKGMCYSGLFWDRDYLAEVAWRGNFATSAFAHELMHARQFLLGYSDPDHTVDADWALAEDAKDALIERGL